MAFNKDITWHARSDTGLIRKVNEDRFLIPDFGLLHNDCARYGLLFAVADGMGGHPGGDVASQLACDLLSDFCDQQVYRARYPATAEVLVAAMEKSFYDIDSRIRERAAGNDALSGMGTTLSACGLAAKRLLLRMSATAGSTG